MNRLYVSLLTIALALVLGRAAAQDKQDKPALPADQLRKIEAALPESAPAKPAKARSSSSSPSPPVTSTVRSRSPPKPSR